MGSAGVNISTGKIVGCEKGSLTWWHEKGHIVYGNSELGIKNSIKRMWAFDYVIAFIIGSLFFDNFKWLAGICFLIMVGFDLYEEHWCWRYADKHFKYMSLDSKHSKIDRFK